jgi:hypothetical protein
LDINTKDLEDFVNNSNDKHPTTKPLFLDSDNRMLYNLIEPKWEKDSDELYDAFYQY